MKYVRTKDGIFAYNDLRVRLTGDYIHERVADTIEELCDEFVVISEYQKKPHTIFKRELEDYTRLFTSKKKSADRVIAIYGEIWVDGELRKVAKMNDKGELELL